MTDPRKEIFDTVRRAAPAGVFDDPGNILALDNLLDALGVEREETSAYRLGSLSERYESGGRGPGTVSTGRGDPGGVSYGTYQLSSRAGTVAAFVAGEGARWAAIFGAAKPGSDTFSARWKDIAEREPDAFAEAQHAFIERTHYRPAVQAVLDTTGLDLDSRHNAIRDATWSCAVQHGGAAKILSAAVASVDKAIKRTSSLYDRQLLDRIYTERSQYVRNVAARLPARQAETLLAMVRNRYPDEFARARRMMA